MTALPERTSLAVEASRPTALVDLLDRLLDGGAVILGDLTLSIADVDLVHVSLHAVIRSLNDTHPWQP
ncbi:gas vesicle protein GvpJ [Streptacidiphilus monticola]|uniref:Gas vesicle protein GvpJ n=1 Tax=Streptacidiphilus monticola TaxID=2161674 RepID=A0ABW1G223_9ACTN